MKRATFMTLAGLLILTACGDTNTSAVARLAGAGAAQPAATVQPANTPAPLVTPTPHLWPTEAPQPVQIAAPPPTAQPVQQQTLAVVAEPTPYTQPAMPNVEPCPVLADERIDPACAANWRQ